MNDTPNHPDPQSGGSFMRDPETGALTPATDAPAEVPQQTTDEPAGPADTQE